MRPEGHGYSGLLSVLLGVLVLGGLVAFVITQVTPSHVPTNSLTQKSSSSPGQPATNAAAVAACKSTARSVQSAVAAFQAETGTYPKAIATLVTTKTIAGAEEGPWLRQTPSSRAFSLSLTSTGALIVRAPPTARGVTFAEQPTAACEHAK